MNCTTQIQAAIDSKKNQSGKVYIPHGSYDISSLLTVAKPGEFLYDFELIGDGHNSTELMWTGAAGGTMLSTGAMRGLRMKGIFFNGGNLAKHCVVYGGDETDGTSAYNRFEDCRFGYATYGAFANDYRLNGWDEKFLHCSFNNSTLGFVTGSPNANLILFDNCAFNDNAFAIGPMGNPSHSSIYTSKITGATFTLYDGSTPCFSGITVLNSLFTNQTEADVLVHAIPEVFNMIGCGGEGSRMLVGDMAGIFVEPAGSRSNAASIFNIEGGFYHSFGTVTDSLDDPFISLYSGLTLSLKGTKIGAIRLAAPRSRIALYSGYLKMENVHFDLYDEMVGSWPTIVDDAALVGPSNVEATNVIIRRGDVGMEYDRQWDVYPVACSGSFPSAMSGRKVLYLSQTQDTAVGGILTPSGNKSYSYDAKSIKVKFVDGHSILMTVPNGGTFFLKGDINVQPLAGSIMVFMSEYSGSAGYYWREISRNF